MDPLVIVFLSTAILYMIWAIIRTAIHFGEDQYKYHIWKEFALASLKEVVPMVKELMEEKPIERSESDEKIIGLDDN